MCSPGKPCGSSSGSAASLTSQMRQKLTGSDVKEDAFKRLQAQCGCGCPGACNGNTAKGKQLGLG